MARIYGAHINKSLDNGADMQRLESLVSMLDTIFANGTTVDGKFCNKYHSYQFFKSDSAIVMATLQIGSSTIKKWPSQL